MKKILFVLFLYLSLQTYAQDKPNILWLVTEDMSPYLSCYGNKMIKTPNLDKLAADGIRFTEAHSNSVQCSPSRSTLVSGIYAISLGTDMHRSKNPVRDDFYFPLYLRNAGYYCVNNNKQDYNNQKTPANVWDVSNGKADYRSRPDKSKPFFAQYNQGITHMTRVISPLNERTGPRAVAMNDVDVPAYIPDLPEVRNDISWNMGAVVKMDEWVGKQIEDLKAAGEYDNTIIFFFSDHGGTVPRGKAYVYESGTHVPLIVSFPPKWKHLAASVIPQVNNKLVSFVDFAPTVLSLAGVPIPEFMHGKPFFTEAAKKKENEAPYLFTFRANQSSSYAPSRAITDGRYKLILNFQSAYPNGTRQDYQWQMPAQQAWDVANKQGKLTSPIYKRFWEPVEQFEFFDLSKDSMEVNNLAADKSYAEVFNRLKGALKSELYKQRDVGLMPPAYRQSNKKEGDLYTLVKNGKININPVIDAAIVASERKVANVPQLMKYLKSGDPSVQYWGASGLCGLAKVGLIKAMPAEAVAAFKSKSHIEEVNNMLAEGMIYTSNSKEALDYLVSIAGTSGTAAATLQNVGNKAKPVAGEILKMLDDKKVKNKFYLRSVLINCDLLPYSDLYKLAPGEKKPEF
ncbi:MAG: betC 8 [Sphingobacteriaceae bacterium]|jgi:arylsulfatase A-like enzyme|nr:betC 8 [Sphingobacteriaceae bacterium]